MGCAFCETGRGGLQRNLAAGEIVAEALAVKVLLGWDCGNIVFMGMGECLDNLGEVARALRVLGVNCCLLPGINDSLEDAREAAAFCAKVRRCILNLIPYNQGRSPIARAPTEEEVDLFAFRLEGFGCLVKKRERMGGSKMAGAGSRAGSLPPKGLSARR
jgi:adenine C2-methylase RlmN of 23S rRNA A2503 and tRNA A37